jgi:hypothetical protein
MGHRISSSSGHSSRPTAGRKGHRKNPLGLRRGRNRCCKLPLLKLIQEGMAESLRRVDDLIPETQAAYAAAKPEQEYLSHQHPPSRLAHLK